MVDHPGGNRVEDDIATQLTQVGIILDQSAFESSLEEVSDALVLAVEPHDIRAFEPVHATGEIGGRGFDGQEKAVGHPDPGDQVPAEAAGRFCERLAKAKAVGVPTQGVLCTVTAGPNVSETPV